MTTLDRPPAVVSAEEWMAIKKAERSRRFVSGEAAPLGVGDLVFPPIVSPTFLLVASVPAVFKPWGLIRGRRTPSRDARRTVQPARGLK